MAAVAVGAAVAMSATLYGCNAILGIDQATAAATAASDPLTCANYCNVISQNCQGPNAEYLPAEDGGADIALCEQICGKFPPGVYSSYPGDAGPATGNTLDCRLWHAHAAGDPANGPVAAELHCPHAGPLGFSFCTDPNESFITNFCQLDVPYCYNLDPRVTVYNGGAAEGNTATIVSKDEQVCESVLTQANGDGGFYQYSGNAPDANVGDLTLAAGNTLNCRLWHFEYAIQSTGEPNEGPQVHCPHTGYPSVTAGGMNGPCVDSDD